LQTSSTQLLFSQRHNVPFLLQQYSRHWTNLSPWTP